MEKLDHATYFPTHVYAVKKPEFLESVREVSDRYLRYLAEVRQEKQMTVMTHTYAHEESIKEFAEYVSQTAWNILQSQGYAMDKLVTFFTEMWTQEHNTISDMAYHVHGMGAQISAFYFLDAPPAGCQFVIHDPRPTKMMINLPQADEGTITDASFNVMFTPEAGTLMFTNAWLPHSFTKNLSTEPCRFVHMNLGVMPGPEPEVEVV